MFYNIIMLIKFLPKLVPCTRSIHPPRLPTAQATESQIHKMQAAQPLVPGEEFDHGLLSSPPSPTKMRRLSPAMIVRTLYFTWLKAAAVRGTGIALSCWHQVDGRCICVSSLDYSYRTREW